MDYRLDTIATDTVEIHTRCARIDWLACVSIGENEIELCEQR